MPRPLKKNRYKVKKLQGGGTPGGEPGHPYEMSYQDSLDVYNNQEELNRLSEAYNAYIEKHTKVFFDSKTGGMQRTYKGDEAAKAGEILGEEFRNKKFELFKEFHKKFPDLDNPYVLEEGNPDFYDSDADIARGKQTWGTNKYETVKPIKEKEEVRKKQPLQLESIDPLPLSKIESSDTGDIDIRDIIKSESISLPKGKESQLVYKASNKTRTGQEPAYYTYWDKDKKQWKRRPVEKEEYDRYMRDNRIQKRQIIKASFSEGGKIKLLKNGGTPPEGEPMSDDDILLALRLYASRNYGGPREYDFLPAADTIAQVESGGIWDALQTGGGPGGGGLQMEGFGRGGSGQTTTASNRLSQLASIVGYDNPLWNIPENVDDASKLTETQQKILWLANMIRAKDVDLESLATGETSLEDFWIKSHGRFPESDIPERRVHWSEVVGTMKDEQAKADAEMEHVEETGDYEKGGKFEVKKKSKMRLLRANKGLKFLKKMLFSGGSIPYEDYGMDDSGMMSYQNAGDQFMDSNVLAGGIPQDAIEAQEPQFHIPVSKSKKELRKEKRKGPQGMRAARRAKRDFRAQLRDERRAAGMKARGRTYRLQKKDYRKGEFKEGKEAAKAIKYWKD